MSRRCRHPERDVFALKWRPVSEEAYRAGYVISSMRPGMMLWKFAGDENPQALWCRRCRSWLPLGHSDETPERVAIEIRAAALVAGFDDCVDEFTVREYHGWRKADQSIESDDLADDEAPGYLAHVIDATHDKETL